jgi:hypothetical protein
MDLVSAVALAVMVQLPIGTGISASTMIVSSSPFANNGRIIVLVSVLKSCKPVICGCVSCATTRNEEKLMAASSKNRFSHGNVENESVVIVSIVVVLLSFLCSFALLSPCEAKTKSTWKRVFISKKKKRSETVFVGRGFRERRHVLFKNAMGKRNVFSKKRKDSQ